MTTDWTCSLLIDAKYTDCADNAIFSVIAPNATQAIICESTLTSKAIKVPSLIYLQLWLNQTLDFLYPYEYFSLHTWTNKNVT